MAEYMNRVGNTIKLGPSFCRATPPPRGSYVFLIVGTLPIVMSVFVDIIIFIILIFWPIARVTVVVTPSKSVSGMS